MGSQPIRKLLVRLLGKLLRKLLRKLLGKLIGILLKKLLDKWRRGQNYLRKTVIGGKIVFRMG